MTLRPQWRGLARFNTLTVAGAVPDSAPLPGDSLTGFPFHLAGGDRRQAPESERRSLSNRVGGVKNAAEREGGRSSTASVDNGVDRAAARVSFSEVERAGELLATPEGPGRQQTEAPRAGRPRGLSSEDADGAGYPLSAAVCTSVVMSQTVSSSPWA